ncbi:DNA-dependent metalloprotease SPRTN-like isoform X2 [Centruroides vittatus]|uniref:DNA-dependent metalloprotease SPRTN-like isoform X2 n=1 Tax=Centruroides vittatus TaxID=120091 RepID=UPI00350FE120
MIENDDDYALALYLQEELNDDDDDDSPVIQECSNGKSVSIVDSFWELNDPNPDIHGLFLEFNSNYFWNKLDRVEVKWSNRMTLCAGICGYEGHGGLCSIRLSLPLLKLRPRKDLVETLLDHDSHGPEFLKHMFRINKLTGANITVYHNFHDEVNSYRQHWWRCNGPCRKKPPFYGIVRRAMNRAPSSVDYWWAEHERTCGGVFVKIKEPENNTSKRNQK